MGQIIPFRRRSAPVFTEPQLNALWVAYSAARQAEIVLIIHGAAERDIAFARVIADQAHCLFKSAFDRSGGGSDAA